MGDRFSSEINSWPEGSILIFNLDLTKDGFKEEYLEVLIKAVMETESIKDVLARSKDIEAVIKRYNEENRNKADKKRSTKNQTNQTLLSQNGKNDGTASPTTVLVRLKYIKLLETLSNQFSTFFLKINFKNGLI